MSTEQDMVTLYIDAEKRILQGKTVDFNGRSWSSENLAELREGRAEWERRLRNMTQKSSVSLADFRG